MPVPGPEATMTDLLVKPSGDRGRVLQVTPQSAGWTYVGFELYRLEPGDTAGGEGDGRELCLVLVSGRASVTAGSLDTGVIGERMSPFGGKPHSVYVPAGSRWSLTAATAVTLAVCSAPGVAGARPPRLIGPG